MRGSDGVERQDLPTWLRGRQAPRPASDDDRPAGVLRRFGVGYKLAVQTHVGLGKTIAAGLTLAALTTGERQRHVYRLPVTGQNRAWERLRLFGVESARSTAPQSGAARAEVPLSPQPFARRRVRARTVPRQERYRELRRRV
ncbi:hypothetical protein GCM10020367_69360 [Streptomyces sannanensis]|uniref:SNF2 N-terminal domain-containing protein n=1 Tax=Streptomyces sannanensis TaxID=285536 RepID=A0ABP6SNE2_9ACTN